MNTLNVSCGLLECDTLFLCPDVEGCIVAWHIPEHCEIEPFKFSTALFWCEFLFSGPLLPSDSDVHSVPLVRSRDKQLLVASILDSFSNLFPSATYLRSNINTGMGFLLGDFLPSDE
jgi:hypothetical protein